MRSIWNWLKRTFGGTAKILERNRVLARAAIRLSLGAFLENNPDYADEVLRALNGLRELVIEGKISTNDELKREISKLVSGREVPLYLRYSIQDVVEAVFSAIDDHASLSGSDYKTLWLDIIDAGISIATLYSRNK